MSPGGSGLAAAAASSFTSLRRPPNVLGWQAAAAHVVERHRGLGACHQGGEDGEKAGPQGGQEG